MPLMSFGKSLNLPLQDEALSHILPKNVYTKKAGDSVPKGLVPAENAVASYEEAVEICKAKVAQIVKECRRVNQKYRDQHFDIEFDLKWGRRDCLDPLGISEEASKSNFRPRSVKRVGDIFDEPQFYIDDATASDVRQGRDGDCWFMAALCTLSNKKGLIERVCVARDEKVGVYGFVFHRDFQWRSEVIDDKLYLTRSDYDESIQERELFDDRVRINSEEEYRKIYQTGSGALYFAQCKDQNETWLPLMEKAYAKAHGDYAAIEGGFTGEGLEDLTGGVTTELLTSDILDKEQFWKDELLKVNQDFLFGCSTGIFRNWGTWGNRKGIQEGHAYSVMKAVEVDDKRLLLLKNPWGEGEWNGPWSDGSKEWTPYWMEKLDHKFGDDGAFWISYDDLLRKYQSFDRTRLFSPEWEVTQQWTSLTIPWVVDYHDTKFSFTLEKDASVVVVLSQLDDRYFKGLKGQYRYQLSFRIHKAGEDEYIVRSHGNYRMSRSVSAELDLEAGEYHVVMRIAAERDTSVKTVEDVIRENCKDRRDKLLRIGLAYDLAHSKGKIVETEEEKKGKKEAEDKKKQKERAAIKEKLIKEKKDRRHNTVKEKRKMKAAKAKREARAAEKERIAKLEKEKRAAGKSGGNTDVKTDAKPHLQVGTEVMTSGDQTSSVDLKDSSSAAVDETQKEQDEKEPETSTATSDSNTTSGDKKPDTVKDDVTEKLKPSTLDAPATTHGSIAPTDTLTVRINDNTISVAGSAFGGDFEDLSDTDSNVSEVTDHDIDAELASTDDGLMQYPPLGPPVPPPMEEEDDEFQREPWNAIVVVGVRVYSKGSSVSIKVARPRTWEEDDSDEKEQQLDVDDSAADATKTTDVAPPSTEVDKQLLEDKVEEAKIEEAAAAAK
ncbi:putative calpain family cysteine protease protein [Coleophoma cylindrospora]|uniref:Putative calpain family cysteine protease protein n=1 Tax=Coleophoma cylindrospora TaxID=1849047 RepID=A0A3D8RCD2_9HELO|nr:putative calpain family cysteine protease protein [Coleophoma cylindrospora]